MQARAVRRSDIWSIGWLCGALAVGACGGESAGSGSAVGEQQPSGSPPIESDGAAGVDPFRVCPTPIGTLEELERTPRADTNLELLALTLDAGQLTATQATYERVVADVEAIRALAPSLATLAFWPPHDGYTLYVTFGTDATDALAAGAYTAWDCLLETYRARVGNVVDIFPTYAPALYLGGIFDLPRLAELFNRLPDASVEFTDTSGRRTLCARRDGEHYEYVVDRTNGGCDAPPPCTGSARHFTSDAPGEIQALESWTASESNPAPAWFRAVCQ